MPLSDHLCCPSCGANAQLGRCKDDCPTLQRRAELLRRAGFDPEAYDGACLHDQVEQADQHRQFEACE